MSGRRTLGVRSNLASRVGAVCRDGSSSTLSEGTDVLSEGTDLRFVEEGLGLHWLLLRACPRP